MSGLKEVLMERDEMTSDEADDAIRKASDAMDEYLADGDMESAEDICSEYFGLEPDYIMDLVG
jgi:hypothetical protein